MGRKEPDASLFDDWTRDYARLGLRLDRIVPGTVLAWIGPTAWRAAIAAEPPPAPGALLDAAGDLAVRLSAANYEPKRHAHLTGQLSALRTLARLAAGEEIPFAQQAELLLGVQPRREPEATFDAAHAELGALLLGQGSLAERLDAWRRATAVPREGVPKALQRLAAEARDRTHRRLPLPGREGVEFVCGEDVPYRAYARYLGRFRTRVEVNIRRPLPLDELVEYVAHEAYPGHHTEHALREQHLYRGEAHGEYAIHLANTPSSLVWEAVASIARGVVFADEQASRLADELAIPRNPLVDPERDQRVWTAVSALDAAQANAAFLLHEDRRPAAEVGAYLAERTLMSTDGAAQFVERLKTLPWRVYVLTYSEGRRLMSPLLSQTDRWDILRRVLTEATWPAMLAMHARSGLRPDGRTLG